MYEYYKSKSVYKYDVQNTRPGLMVVSVVQTIALVIDQFNSDWMPSQRSKEAECSYSNQEDTHSGHLYGYNFVNTL